MRRSGYSYILLNGLFVLETEHNDSSCFVTEAINELTWYAHLGYIGQEMVNRLANNGLLGSLKKVSI